MRLLRGGVGVIEGRSEDVVDVALRAGRRGLAPSGGGSGKWLVDHVRSNKVEASTVRRRLIVNSKLKAEWSRSQYGEIKDGTSTTQTVL